MLYISLEPKEKVPPVHSLTLFCAMLCRNGKLVRNVHASGERYPIEELRSGLYTSPHLVAVRERIRINGAPISEEKFARFFFEVWDKLVETEVGAFS